MKQSWFHRLLRGFAGVLVLGSILCVFSGCGSTRVTKETDEVTVGIDVAKYQGTIDWQQLPENGVQFAMVRIGYRTLRDGVIEEDSNGRYNLQEAGKAGIPVGVYFFSTAISEAEAQEEAQWVANLISQYPITYPVVYDCEGFRDQESRQYGMSSEERTNVALAFLKTIKKLGYEGMFYGSKNELEMFWEMERIEKHYKVWVAQYPAEPYPATSQSSYTGEHHMWQYTKEGTVPGIETYVDLNLCYFGYDGIEPAKDLNPPEEVGPDPEALMRFSPVSEQVTAKVETNLRDIPSQDTDSEVLYTLKNGEIAERIAVSDSGWSKLSYQGNTYYAVTSYLTTDLNFDPAAATVEPDEDGITTQFQSCNDTVTAKKEVNLRKLPSVEREDATILAVLKNGDVATRIGTSDNGWSKLTYNGETCYAVTSYLKVVSEDGIDITDVNEDDIDIKFKPCDQKVTAKEEVNLRKIPNTERKDATIITRLKNGDVATRVGISDNGWSKLIYNGVTCYAASRYLVLVDDNGNQETKPAGEIQTQFEECNDQVTAKLEVNLRTMPSVEDPACVVVASIKNGEVVTRTGINRDVGWSRVLYNGQTLYCVSSYLMEAE